MLYRLGLPDILRISHGRALALYGRLNVLSAGGRLPIPAAVFAVAATCSGQTALGQHRFGPNWNEQVRPVQARPV